MKKLITFFVSLLLGVVFCTALFRYVVTWQELKTELEGVSFLEWGVLVLFSFICFSTAVWRWRGVLADLGYTFTLEELAGPSLSAFGIVYLIPIGIFWADILRARLIRRKRKIPLSKGLASVFIDRIFNSFFNLLLVFSGLFIFFHKAGTLWLELRHIYLIAILFFFFTFLMVFFFITQPRFLRQWGGLDFLLNSFSREEKLSREVKREIITFFREENLFSLFKISLLSLVRSSALILLSFLIVLFLGYPLSFSSTWALFGPTFASLETPITADLGSHDLTSAFVFEGLGLKRGTGVAYAFLFRTANLSLVAVGFSYLAYALFGKEFIRTRFYKPKNDDQQ